MKKIPVALFSVMLPFLVAAHPNKVVYRKTIHKDYQLKDKDLLHLGNKYGRIALHTWNKNEVQATIIVSGYGQDLHEAEQIADLVNIDASQAADQGDVSISTSYNKPSAGLSSLWHLLFSGAPDKTGSYVNIDYEVYVPASLRMLDVENNYGDVTADTISCPFNLAMNYCRFDLDGISEPLTVRMDYSKGTISHAVSINLSAKYSTLDNEETGSISTRSDYSNYRLQKVGTFSLHSDYDEVQIDQLTDLSGESDYTHYRIGKLDGSADLHMDYGDFKVGTLGKDFRKISVTSTYGGVYLGISPGTAFQLEANLSYGNLKTGNIPFKNVISNTQGAKKSFSGLGDGANELSPLISFHGTYADLVLKSP
ncbi:MAG TPA: hypothetical protein VNE41_10955 [Chitinophagaceae bacterium]|nr:hypothetical protein [Chitinophagaceae bacterium]